MLKLKIFSFDKSSKSYTYPVVKILICSLLIFVFINRNHIIQIDNHVINLLVGILCAIISISCILCIYISVFELFQTHENRKQKRIVSGEIIEKSKEYSIDELVHMVNNNDIIDIEIVSDSKIFKIGSSSDCLKGNSKFFDKLFYVNETEYKNIESFKDAIQTYSDNGMIMVISIDGLSPDYYNI